MKRLQESPTGLSPSEKERRDKSPTMNEHDEHDVAGQGVQVTDNAASSVPRITARSILSSSSRNPRRGLEKECSYRVATQIGPWRDVLTVDIWSVDGVDFKGVVRPNEAKAEIFVKALNQRRDNLHGIKIEFQGHPVVTFRLKTQINVDVEFQDDKFTFHREGPEGLMVFAGSIRGVRVQSQFQPGGMPFPQDKSRRTRVKIKNCDWSLSEEEIKKWLEKYGEIVIPLSEEVHEEAASDTDEDEGPIGTGNYWVTMILEKKIPQFLPMYSKKVEVYYRGMEQLCNKCYKRGHLRSKCEEKKVEWMDYVVDFIQDTDYEPEVYGKWMSIAKGHFRKREA